MAKQMDRQKQSARKDTAKKTADKACIAARPRTATEVAKTSRIGASFFCSVCACLAQRVDKVDKAAL